MCQGKCSCKHPKPVEHKAVIGPGTCYKINVINDFLHKHGADGWELANFHPHTQEAGLYIFRRPATITQDVSKVK